MATKKVVRKKAATKANKQSTPNGKKATAKKSTKKAARKKATTRNEAPSVGRFAEQKLFFAGRPERYGNSLKEFKDWASEEGATVQKKLTPDTDILIELSQGATAAAKKEAAKLNTKGASIVTISEREFRDRFLPTADEVIEQLARGEKGRQHISNLLDRSRPWQASVLIDLRGADLRGCDLSEMKMWVMDLEGADMRECRLYGAERGELKNVRLEKAHGEYFHPSLLVNCKFQKAHLEHMYLSSYYGQQPVVVDCDFTGANLNDARISYDKIERTTFKNAILTRMDFHDSTFEKVCFDGADLTEAELPEIKCKSDVSFVGANLQRIDAKSADFSGADLRKADLRGATLLDANFNNAKLDGANFKDALLFGATFDGADTSKAKNLTLPSQTTVSTGKACRDLDAAAKKAQRLQVEARVLLPDGGKVHMAAVKQWNYGGSYVASGLAEENVSQSFQSQSLSDSLSSLAAMWGHGELQFGSIKATMQKSPVKGKVLQELAIQALCEVFDTEPPTEEELKEKKKKVRQAKDSLKEEVLAELRGGRKGILEFNKRDLVSLVKQKFTAINKEDFSGVNLNPLKVEAFGFTNCNFNEASLKKARLKNCDLRRSTFQKADLTGCDLNRTDASGCDFSSANLSGVKMAGGALTKAALDGADLSGADLSRVSLLGAQLGSAKLTRVKWKDNAFDEATTFPDKFRIPDHFQFVGKGDDPRIAQDGVVEDVQDFEAFMKKLEDTVDKSRLSKSLKMLKADRFELFSDVTDESIVGVVKSQTDKDLVYSCRLTSGGEFCCCTQNLNPCGGLRGALCKHLLVLLVGLTKGEALSAQDAATWARASGRRKPALDKDAMAETLLKYKGAEAGEVDWRPTETVPEDYYAF